MIIKLFKVVFIEVIDKRGLTTINMTKQREIEDDTFFTNLEKHTEKLSTHGCGSTRYFF